MNDSGSTSWLDTLSALIGAGSTAYAANQAADAQKSLAASQSLAAKLSAAASSVTARNVIFGVVGLLVVVLAVSFFRGGKS